MCHCENSKSLFLNRLGKVETPKKKKKKQTKMGDQPEIIDTRLNTWEIIAKKNQSQPFLSSSPRKINSYPKFSFLLWPWGHLSLSSAFAGYQMPYNVLVIAIFQNRILPTPSPHFTPSLFPRLLKILDCILIKTSILGFQSTIKKTNEFKKYSEYWVVARWSTPSL